MKQWLALVCVLLLLSPAFAEVQTIEPMNEVDQFFYYLGSLLGQPSQAYISVYPQTGKPGLYVFDIKATIKAPLCKTSTLSDGTKITIRGNELAVKVINPNGKVLLEATYKITNQYNCADSWIQFPFSGKVSSADPNYLIAGNYTGCATLYYNPTTDTLSQYDVCGALKGSLQSACLSLFQKGKQQIGVPDCEVRATVPSTPTPMPTPGRTCWQPNSAKTSCTSGDCVIGCVISGQENVSCNFSTQARCLSYLNVAPPPTPPPTPTPQPTVTPPVCVEKHTDWVCEGAMNRVREHTLADCSYDKEVELCSYACSLGECVSEPKICDATKTYPEGKEFKFVNCNEAGEQVFGRTVKFNVELDGQCVAKEDVEYDYREDTDGTCGGGGVEIPIWFWVVLIGGIALVAIVLMKGKKKRKR